MTFVQGTAPPQPRMLGVTADFIDKLKHRRGMGRDQLTIFEYLRNWPIGPVLERTGQEQQKARVVPEMRAWQRVRGRCTH
ncbi:hypothetical protein D3C71_2111640 [compost metagenome]